MQSVLRRFGFNRVVMGALFVVLSLLAALAPTELQAQSKQEW